MGKTLSNTNTELQNTEEFYSINQGKLKKSNRLKLRPLMLSLGAAIMLGGCGGGGGGETAGADEEERRGGGPPPVVPVVPPVVPVVPPVVPVVGQATEIVARNDDPNHFLVNTNGGRQKEYDFELIPNIAGADLSDYNCTAVIANAQFDIVSTRRNNNHCYVTVRYTASLNDVQEHRAELVVTATHPVTAHVVNRTIPVVAQEPFNVMLHRYAAGNVGIPPLITFFNDIAQQNLNVFFIGNGWTYVDKSRLYSSGNVTIRADDAWREGAVANPGVAQYQFPFNVPVIQTYNPTDTLFFNPIALKTQAQNGHVMYFVVQYLPAVGEIETNLGSQNLNDPRFNTTLKYHALFSDGRPGHAAVNLIASLSVDGGVAQPITIYPHDGVWSPAVNSPLLKDKILSADPLNPPVSSVTVSTLRNIAQHPNLEIHSVHVLLDDADFNIFYQHLHDPNFNMHQFLRDNAHDIPQALQEGINHYRQLFQHHRIEGVQGGVNQGVVPGGVNQGERVENEEGQGVVPGGVSATGITQTMLDDIDAILAFAGTVYMDFGDEDKGLLFNYAREAGIITDTTLFISLSENDYRNAFAHLWSQTPQAVKNALVANTFPAYACVEQIYKHYQLEAKKLHDQNELRVRHAHLMLQLNNHNNTAHQYTSGHYQYSTTRQNEYETSVTNYDTAHGVTNGIFYQNLFSQDIYQALNGVTFPAITENEFRACVSQWMNYIPLAARTGSDSGNMGWSLGLDLLADNIPTDVSSLPRELREKYYLVSQRVPDAIITHQQPSDAEKVALFRLEYATLFASGSPFASLPSRPSVRGDNDVIITFITANRTLEAEIRGLWERDVRGLWAARAYNCLDGCHDGKNQKLNQVIAGIPADVIARIIPGLYPPQLTILPKIASLLSQFKARLLEQTLLQTYADVHSVERDLYKRIQANIELGKVTSNPTQIPPVGSTIYFPGNASNSVPLNTAVVVDRMLAHPNLRGELINYIYAHFQGAQNLEDGMTTITKDDLLPFKYSPQVIVDYATNILIGNYTDSRYSNDISRQGAHVTAHQTYKRGMAENILQVLGILR